MIIETMEKKYHESIGIYDSKFTVKMITKRMSVLEITSLSDYQQYLYNNGDEAYELSKILLVQYSSFFRSETIFGLIKEAILPAIKLRKNPGESIRIWSAGCSTGEEIYSVAMVVDEFVRKDNGTQLYTLFASDIDAKVVEKAQEGEYYFEQLGNIKLDYYHRYFKKMGSIYKVDENLTKKIDFSVHDLLDKRIKSPTNAIFGHFDIILCNNLLFYYSEDHQAFIINRLLQSLSPDGYLICEGASMNRFVKNQSVAEFKSHADVYKRKGEKNF